MADKEFIEITGNSRLRGAKTIEDIMCLTVLIAKKEIPYNSKVSDAAVWMHDNLADDCFACKYVEDCLACIINE